MVLSDVCSELEVFIKKTEFNRIYLFGSLINRDGCQFDLQVSDIDTVCTFTDHCSYLKRWKAVRAAKDPVGRLNHQLLRMFKRTDASMPIVSIVPVSALELEFGIHKDRALQFFSHNKFLNIDTDKTGSIGNEYQTINPEIEGALDAVREAQRYRNKYLAISPSGSRSVSAYEGPDVLPKGLSRCAAQVRWARESNHNTGHRFDLNEGLIYILQLLTARRNEATEVDDLLQRVAVRMGGEENQVRYLRQTNYCFGRYWRKNHLI